ncbi:MAG TPA: BolA/IbaG family iron-sulfur metabolism protein [Thermoanaerobaculia bacterium]|nr:BolA/IbaG family iron-sulfur metabolism protein [Thermoanaerobaculia bacterium]
MALHIHRPAAETAERVREALSAAIPGAEIAVSGMGGHFEIRVVSVAFAGANRLARQRLVLGAIAHLMKGDDAPVHAVDRIETLTPGESGPAPPPAG